MKKSKYDYCKECQIELKPVRQPRTNFKKCSDCRSDDIKGANELRYIYKNSINNPIPESETEIGDGSMFEDIPDDVAEKEVKYGKVDKRAVGYVFSENLLSEIIIEIKERK
jgi:DNA-directed RNA polymerase subunit M/transcription elongation factor TFIIS|tara:strand:- start:651 stop:983 length:333 start_codon:yes stop_codon:yes gene_type:complete